VPSLNELATKQYDTAHTYGELIHFVHILVMEPHPQSPDLSPYGARVWEARYSTIGQPRSYEERAVVARELEDLIEGQQLLLVDDLSSGEFSNPVWCTYGPAPNSAFLIRQDGIIDTAQTWLDVREVRMAIDALLGGLLPTPSRTPGRNPTQTAAQAPTQAPMPLPTPNPVQVPGLEGVAVRAICLEVDQFYPGIEGKTPEPIAESVEAILAQMGVRVVSTGQACDATLTLDLTLEALGDTYSGDLRCYNGSSVRGEMVFSVPGQPSLTVPVSGERPAPKAILKGDCRSPLTTEFNRSWVKAILDAMAELWGPVVFPSAIAGLESGYVRKTAVAVVEEMGPQAMEAVPALIDILEDALSMMWIPGSQVERTLEAITGQDFGDQPDLWWQWWAERH